MKHVIKPSKPIDVMDEINNGAEQYLTFLLGKEEYGIEILRVQEIKGWDNITIIPNTPDYLCGVLNLRGTIIPIVDLRRWFDLPAKKFTPTTVVIVLKVNDVSDRIVGIVVDAVSDAYNVMPEDIQATPDLGMDIDTKYINGLVKIKNKMMMLLNIEHLLSIESLR